MAGGSSKDLVRKQPFSYANIAICILSIPPSSCDCERSFSELSDMPEPRRSQMRPNIIAALQCTRSWNRNGFIKRRK